MKVSDDPALTPEEKETLISFSRADDRATIHSEQAVVVKWLLRHPEYEEDNRRERDGTIHATTGTLPVGCLKLQGNSRSSHTPGRVLGKLPGGDD